MAYRSEEERLRAKVSSLESELASTRQDVERLRGREEQPVSEGEQIDRGRFQRPRGVRLARELPFEIDAAGYEAIAECLRHRLGLTVSQVGSTLRSSDGSFKLTREGTTTRVELMGSWSLLDHAPASVGILGGLFGAGGVAAVLHDAHVASPAHALWVAPLLVAPVVYAMYRRVDTQSNQALERHRGAFAAVLDLAAEHRAAPAASPRVRVGADAEEALLAEARLDEAERSRSH